jgi:hypothetical protein
MSRRRTQIEDGIHDIGLGSVLTLLSLLFGVPSVAGLSSEIRRSGTLNVGAAIVIAGVSILLLLSIRILARGFSECFADDAAPDATARRLLRLRRQA